MNNICTYCKKIYSTPYILIKHTNTCKELLRQKIDELTIEKYKILEEREIEKKEKEQEIILLKEEINRLTTENTILKQTSEERKINYDILLDKFDRPNNMIIINETINEQFEYKTKIKESMPLFTDEYVDKGIKGFTQFLCDHILNNFITTKHSRNILDYKRYFYNIVKEPDCLTLINKTLIDNNEEIINKSLVRMIHYKQLMNSDNEEYAFCSEEAMNVYELNKFAMASVNQKLDENIKALVKSLN